MPILRDDRIGADRILIRSGLLQRTAREIAFTRATAYQDDDSQPVAYSVGTFMRGSSSAAIGKGDAARQQEMAK